MPPKRRRTNRRRKRGSTRRSRSSNAFGVRGITVRTSRQIRGYVHIPSTPPGVGGITDWLDLLIDFSLLAFRLVAMVVNTRPKPSAPTIKAYRPVCCVQEIIVGVDDLIKGNQQFFQWGEFQWKQDPKKDETVTKYIPYCEYKSALVHWVTVTITAGSSAATYAGKMAAALLPLPMNMQLARYIKDHKDPGSEEGDELTYENIQQMPSSKVVNYGKPVHLHLKLGNMLRDIGQHTFVANDAVKHEIMGGLPFAKLMIAYSDFAEASGRVANLYSPEEAIFEITMRASITFVEPGKRYLRDRFIFTQDYGNVHVISSTGGPSTFVKVSKLVREPSYYREVTPEEELQMMELSEEENQRD